jgi:8-oxo-dGTP pyrophosphatase MutT (NUDIX family)
MPIKIYFGEKAVLISDQSGRETDQLLNQPRTLLIHIKGDNNPNTGNSLPDVSSSPQATESVREAIEAIHRPDVDTVILLTDNYPSTLEAFYQQFTIIQAGGGAVWNDKGELLFIHRRGKWDLPKGKLDEGETIEACAVREVEEETGLVKPTILRALPTTYHTYQEDGKPILKESYWFEMKVSGEQNLNPQTEEQITETVWLDKTSWDKVRANTFPSILDVISSL